MDITFRMGGLLFLPVAFDFHHTRLLYTIVYNILIEFAFDGTGIPSEVHELHFFMANGILPFL